jgi:hypothetical protein
MFRHCTLIEVGRRTLALAALLVLCAACSSSPDDYCDGPQPGVIALFDPFSMVFAGEHPTEIQICDSYRCDTRSFDPEKQGTTHSRLAIPRISSTSVITDLTISVNSNGKLLRKAHAPGPLVVLKPGQAAGPCGNKGITVSYNPQTKELESGPLSW